MKITLKISEDAAIGCFRTVQNGTATPDKTQELFQLAALLGMLNHCWLLLRGDQGWLFFFHLLQATLAARVSQTLPAKLQARYEDFVVQEILAVTGLASFCLKMLFSQRGKPCPLGKGLEQRDLLPAQKRGSGILHSLSASNTV